MAETFDYVQKKNIALVPSQLLKRSLQRHSKRGMCARSARLQTRRLLGIVVGDFSLALPAAPSVVAGVNQDPVSPGDETRLAAKAGDAALHLQERLLHRIVGVGRIAKNIAGQVLHARSVHPVEALVSV